MLVPTRGIVVRNTKYGEGSLISKIYTDRFGMESFIVNGVFSPKAAIKASLLQPMTMLDMVVYYNRLKEIQRIKEAKCYHIPETSDQDRMKTGILLFVSEVLNKAIKEQEPNIYLFEFIEQAVVQLHQEKGPLALWPQWFLASLAIKLGFAPENNYAPQENPYFDLAEGRFSPFPQKTEWAMDAEESAGFSRILSMGKVADHIPKNIRSGILQKTVLYYRLHLPDFQNIKSLEVLTGLF